MCPGTRHAMNPGSGRRTDLAGETTPNQTQPREGSESPKTTEAGLVRLSTGKNGIEVVTTGGKACR